MRERRRAYKVLGGKMKERDHLGDPSTDKMILK
jgi:hypothetical protein